MSKSAASILRDARQEIDKIRANSVRLQAVMLARRPIGSGAVERRRAIADACWLLSCGAASVNVKVTPHVARQLVDERRYSVRPSFFGCEIMEVSKC
jgi:hypothetical protein